MSRIMQKTQQNTESWREQTINFYCIRVPLPAKLLFFTSKQEVEVGYFGIKHRKCLYFFAKCPPKWKKTIKKMIFLPGRSSSFLRDVLLADILLQLLWYSNLLWWIVGCSQGHFLPFFYSSHFSTDRPKRKTIKNENQKNLAPLCL